MRSRKREDAWTAVAAKLPGPHAVRLEPCLRGMENNPAFRFVAWHERRHGRLRRSLGKFPLRQFLEDLSLAGVASSTLACGFWGVHAARSRAPLGLRISIACLASILIALPFTPPEIRKGAIAALSLFFIHPGISTVFGWSLAETLFEPYGHLSSARRDLRRLRWSLLRPSAYLRIALGCLGGLALGVGAILFVWAAALIANGRSGFWDAVWIWGRSAYAEEVFATFTLLVAGAAFISRAVPLAVSRHRRHTRFLGLVRDARRLQRLYRRLDDARGG